jgi:multidrug efflux pump subunit AcrB
MFVKLCQVTNIVGLIIIVVIILILLLFIGQKWEFHPEDDSMLGMIKISTENQARFQHVESRVKNILKFFNTENIKELGMDIDNRMMTVNGI